MLHLRNPISPIRIAGYSAALALHVAAVIFISLPAAGRTDHFPEAESVTQVAFIPVVGRNFRPAPPAPPPPPLPAPKPKPPKAKALASKPVPEPLVPDAQLAVQATHLVTVLDEQEEAGLDLPQPDTPPSEILSYRSSNPPVYPPEAIAAGDAGWVTLRVLVDIDGAPLTFVLAKSTATDRLVDAAIAAVKQWRFNPAMKDGQPVAAWIEVPIGFYNQRQPPTAALALEPPQPNGP